MALQPPVSIPLTVLPPHDCSYLPDRKSQVRAFAIRRLAPAVYQQFMDAGFRRSGQMIYQPVCEGCSECISLRVPVELFKPDKSQRRCARRNADLVVSHGMPELTDEKLDLYQRYVTGWHAREHSKENPLDRESLESFLYTSPVNTLEFCYRDTAGKLLAVGIADVCTQSFSSVYFYFDPEESDRGLGTFGAIYELNFARAKQILYYYLGYWVRECAAMQYKSRFRPCQILACDGLWRDL